MTLLFSCKNSDCISNIPGNVYQNMICKEIVSRHLMNEEGEIIDTDEVEDAKIYSQSFVCTRCGSKAAIVPLEDAFAVKFVDIPKNGIVKGYLKDYILEYRAKLILAQSKSTKEAKTKFIALGLNPDAIKIDGNNNIDLGITFALNLETSEVKLLNCKPREDKLNVDFIKRSFIEFYDDTLIDVNIHNIEGHGKDRIFEVIVKNKAIPEQITIYVQNGKVTEIEGKRDPIAPEVEKAVKLTENYMGG